MKRNRSFDRILRPTLVVALTALAFVAAGCEEEAPGAASVGVLTPDALLSSPPAGALILDVRTPEEFASGHVPNAINIPHTELATRMSEIESAVDSPVVVYCERGGRAGKAEAELLAAGYSNVLHLEGDMSAWRAAGRPVEASSAN